MARSKEKAKEPLQFKPEDLTPLPNKAVFARIATAYKQFNAGEVFSEDKLYRTLMDAAWALLQKEAAKKLIGDTSWLQIGDVADRIDDYATNAVIDGVLPKLRAGKYKSASHLINSLMKTLGFRIQELQDYAYEQHTQVPVMIDAEDEHGEHVIENPDINEKQKIHLGDGLDIGMPADDRAEAAEYAEEDARTAKNHANKLGKIRARQCHPEVMRMNCEGIIGRLRAGKMERLPQYTTERHVALVGAIYMGHSLEEAAQVVGMAYGSARNLVSMWQQQARVIEDTPTVPTYREYRLEHARYMAKLRGTAQLDALVGDIVYRNPKNPVDKIWQRDVHAWNAFKDWKWEHNHEQGQFTTWLETEEFAKLVSRQDTYTALPDEVDDETAKRLRWTRNSRKYSTAPTPEDYDAQVLLPVVRDRDEPIYGQYQYNGGERVKRQPKLLKGEKLRQPAPAPWKTPTPEQRQWLRTGVKPPPKPHSAVRVVSVLEVAA